MENKYPYLNKDNFFSPQAQVCLYKVITTLLIAINLGSQVIYKGVLFEKKEKFNSNHAFSLHTEL